MVLKVEFLILILTTIKAQQRMEPFLFSTAIERQRKVFQLESETIEVPLQRRRVRILTNRRQEVRTRRLLSRVNTKKLKILKIRIATTVLEIIN